MTLQHYSQNEQHCVISNTPSNQRFMVKKSEITTNCYCLPSEIQVLIATRAILTIFLSFPVNITFSLPIPSEQLVNGN